MTQDRDSDDDSQLFRKAIGEVRRLRDVTPPPATPKPAGRSRADRILEAVLTQRIVLLGILIVIVVAWLMYLSANGYLSGDYDFDYMSAVLIEYLAPAETVPLPRR